MLVIPPLGEGGREENREWYKKIIITNFCDELRQSSANDMQTSCAAFNCPKTMCSTAYIWTRIPLISILIQWRIKCYIHLISSANI